MKRLMSALVVWCVLILPAVVRAAPLDDRVPHDVLFYAGWAGADALAPQYGQSNLKGLIEASKVRDFIAKQLPALIEKAAQNDPSAPENIAKAQVLMHFLWQHPTAFYFRPVDFTNPRKPAPHFGIMCDAGSDAKALGDMVAQLLKQAPPTDDFSVQSAQEGNIVLLTFGHADSLADLKAGGALSADATYMKVMGQVKTGQPAVAVYGDLRKVMAMIDEAMNKAGDNGGAPPEVKVKYAAVVDALGVKSLSQFAYAGGFEGKGWTEQGFMGISGARKGIVSLLAGAPLSDTVLSVVPKDAASCSAFRMDLHRLYTEALATISKIDERAAMEVDRGIGQMNDVLGLNLETDILAPLGDEWVVYRSRGDSGLTTALVSKLKDPAAFAKSLDTVEKAFNEKSGAPFKIEKVVAGKQEVSALLFMQYSVTWTVHDGYLVVSSLAGIAPALAQIDDKAPSIATSDSYKQVMAGMPKGIKPTGISYAQPALIYPEIRTMVLGILPLLRAQGVDVPMTLLPDPTQISAMMPPGGAVRWSDADGVHVMGHSAFPGAEILGEQVGPSSAVALAAATTGLVLPPAARSRNAAVEVQQMNALRMMYQGCMMWVAVHNGAMPDHLARLVADGSMPPQTLAAARSGTQALTMTPELQKLATDDFTKFAEQVEQHSDFVYLGTGINATKTPRTIVLAYQKPQLGAPGMLLLFADGQIRRVLWSEVAATFAPTNAWRATNNQPPIDIAALTAAAGQTPAQIQLQPARRSPAPSPSLP